MLLYCVKLCFADDDAAVASTLKWLFAQMVANVKCFFRHSLVNAASFKALNHLSFTSTKDVGHKISVNYTQHDTIVDKNSCQR